MVFYIVGVGPGDPEYLTIKAVKTVSRCSVVIAWRAVLEQFGWLLDGKEVVEVSSNPYEAIERMVKRASLDDVCLLLRGDPSVAERKLMNTIKSYCGAYSVECVVISGVSSVNLALSRTWIDLSDAVVVSLHSLRDIEEGVPSIRDAIQLKRYLVIYPKPGLSSVKALAKELLKLLCCDPKVYVLQKLSFADESVEVLRLSELLSLDNHIDSYTILVVEPCEKVCQQ